MVLGIDTSYLGTWALGLGTSLPRGHGPYAFSFWVHNRAW